MLFDSKSNPTSGLWSYISSVKHSNTITTLAMPLEYNPLYNLEQKGWYVGSRLEFEESDPWTAEDLDNALIGVDQLLNKILNSAQKLECEVNNNRWG